MLVQNALHLTANVINAILQGISLPSAGNQEPIDTQIMHLFDLVLDAGQQGQPQGQAVEGVIDHKAEKNNPI